MSAAPTRTEIRPRYPRGRWTCLLCDVRSAEVWAEVTEVRAVRPWPAVLALEELERLQADTGAWGEVLTLRPWCAVRACLECEEVIRRWGLDLGADWLAAEAPGVIRAMAEWEGVRRQRWAS